MRELSVQASNGTEKDDDREAVQKEIEQLQDELTRISSTTEFNTMKLLDGSLGSKSASSQGATLTGSSVATFGATTITTPDIKAYKLSALTTSTVKDTFEIDGQKFTVAWSKGEAKDFLAKYASDYSTTAMTAGQTKSMAADLESLLNNAAADAGVSGTVSITSDAQGVLKMKSNNTSEDSSFGFVGTDSTNVDANKNEPGAASSFGAVLMGTNDKNTNKVVDATQKFANTIAAGSNFTMTINGTEIQASITALNEGTSTMDDVATALKTSIDAAVTKYNTAMGTGSSAELDAIDFTVEKNKDGSLNVVYNGDKDISFSFGELTDANGVTGTIATKLGLTNKQSASATSNKGIELQIGANEGQTMEFTIDDMSAAALGVDGNKVDLATQDGAQKATTTIDAAIKKVSAQRSKLGAVQNRLEHTIANLDTAAENTQTSESRIRDTDMASEMVVYSKNNILLQAGQSMLAQANQSNQGVLSLLQ